MGCLPDGRPGLVHYRRDFLRGNAGASTVVIDLLSVYSNDALTAAASIAQMEATIQAAVDTANLAFQDSNVNASFRLVHVAHVNYDTLVLCLLNN